MQAMVQDENRKLFTFLTDEFIMTEQNKNHIKWISINLFSTFIILIAFRIIGGKGGFTLGRRENEVIAIDAM